MKKFIVAAGIAVVLAMPVAAKFLGLGRKSAEAMLINANGQPIGKATVRNVKGAIRINIDISGLTPGDHGLHLHNTGKCEGPTFASAGPHWNPDAHQHGRDNPQGAHTGDLPNINVGGNGRAKAQFDIVNGRIDGSGGLLDDDGATIVVHARSDDQRTDPSGNSGDRIACGVLVVK